MNTVDTDRSDNERSTVAMGKYGKVILRGLAVLAVAVLAGLVFTRYEAGITPADPTPAIAHEQFIRVTVANQSPRVAMESAAGNSQHRAADTSRPRSLGS
jgi:hypothetical protein